MNNKISGEISLPDGAKTKYVVIKLPNYISVEFAIYNKFNEYYTIIIDAESNYVKLLYIKMDKFGITDGFVCYKHGTEKEIEQLLIVFRATTSGQFDLYYFIDKFYQLQKSSECKKSTLGLLFI